MDIWNSLQPGLERILLQLAIWTTCQRTHIWFPNCLNDYLTVLLPCKLQMKYQGCRPNTIAASGSASNGGSNEAVDDAELARQARHTQHRY